MKDERTAHNYIRQRIFVLLIWHSVMMNAIIGTTINDR